MGIHSGFTIPFRARFGARKVKLAAFPMWYSQSIAVLICWIVVASADTGCFLTEACCPALGPNCDQTVAKTTAKDRWGEEHTTAAVNKGACLKRARARYEFCNCTTPVAAAFKNATASGNQTWPTGGAKDCASDPFACTLLPSVPPPI